MKKIIWIAFFIFVSFFLGCPKPQPKLDPQPSPADSRIQELNIAIVLDPDKSSDGPHLDVMIDTIADKLGNHLTLVSEDSSNVQGYIRLWLKTQTKYDVAIEGDICLVTIGTHAVRKETSQEYWRFQMSSGDRFDGKIIEPVPVALVGEEAATKRAIVHCATAVAKKIIKSIKNNKQISSTKNYQLRFVGFSASDTEKINDTLDDLASGKQPSLKIKKGGAIAGNSMDIRIKWLKEGEQAKVVQAIKEAGAENEIVLQSTSASPGIITFEP